MQCVTFGSVKIDFYGIDFLWKMILLEFNVLYIATNAASFAYVCWSIGDLLIRLQTPPPSHTVCIKQLLYFCSKMTQICLCSVVAVRDGSNQLHLVQPSCDAEANNYITSRCKTQCYYVIEFLLLLMSLCYWFIAIELSLLFYCFSMLLLLCCCY